MTAARMFAAFVLTLSLFPATVLAITPETEGQKLLHAAGVHGGLVVHLNCGDSELTAELCQGDGFLVQGLDKDPADVTAARERIASKGLFGQVSVNPLDGKGLPYVDNLVNLVVAEDLGEVPMSEVMRVLAPLGVAMIKTDGTWTRTQKPWPAEIDEWPQYLHGSDNNAVAQDTVVGPPRHMQWVTDPAWSRSHMAISTVVSMVSARGRLFTIEDTATPENPFLPGRFAIVARGAFNGVVLWRREIDRWESITRYIKDIAIQLQTRMVAVDDALYVTPGLDAPLHKLDAATGEILKVYEGTARTREVSHHDGVLYLIVGDPMNAAQYNIVKAVPGKGISLGGTDPQAPFDGTGFRGAYAPEVPDKLDPVCAVVALDPDSGETLWRIDDLHHYTASSLAIRGDRAVYQTAGGLFCVKAKTGERLWAVEKPIQSNDGTEANIVVLTDDAVYAKEGGSLVAYSAEDGTVRWTGSIANNYEKAADLFVTGGRVWTGGSKQPMSFDPATGEQLSRIDQLMTGPMSHDRCYRNFITSKYYINSKTGGADFLDLVNGTEMPNHWLRGTCGMGVLPCNGMLYVPPFSCQCSIGAMISNFNAIRSEPGMARSDQPIEVQREVRLVKGPAYGGMGLGAPGIIGPGISTADDWPTYRGSVARGGTLPGSRSRPIMPELKQLWKTDLGGALTPITAAANRVFVADADSHTVYALDFFGSGQVVWKYIAGGRVDSPPTYYHGCVLFGSRDGWVHCLRADDGTLVWRMKDLPDKLICAHGRVESAWPVSGSMLVKDDVAYFTAGRSSLLDGGIFVYAVDPHTGEILQSRRVFGPFSQGTGFPETGSGPFKGDILVADPDDVPHAGEEPIRNVLHDNPLDAVTGNIYCRHKAFTAADLSEAAQAKPHLIPSAGFLDGTPQHRTYWTYGTGYQVGGGSRPSGDILVTDGTEFYEVRGFPTIRHSYFDPRKSGYQLHAGQLAGSDVTKSPTEVRRDGRRGKGEKKTGDASVKWTADIPLTGKAMLLTDDLVLVAGTPIGFPEDDESAERYRASYEGRLGGVLWIASRKDGKKLAEYKLDAAPVWDSLAAADGKVLITLMDGSVICFAADGE